MSPGHAAALSGLHGVKQEPGLPMGLLVDQNHRYNYPYVSARIFFFLLYFSFYLVSINCIHVCPYLSVYMGFMVTSFDFFAPMPSGVCI